MGESKKFVARFNFTTEGLDTEGAASIKDLLEEIRDEDEGKGKEEDRREDSVEITYGSLGATLNFLTRFTGDSFLDRQSPRALNTLKLIKALYRAVQKCKRLGLNLLKHLEMPTTGKTASLEYRTDGKAQRYQHAADSLRALLSKIEVGISPRVLASIREFVPESRNELETISLHDRLLLKPLEDKFALDKGRLVVALEEMTALARSFPVGPVMTDSPAHEKVYIHIRGLELQHFALELPDILSRSTVTHPIGSIAEELEVAAEQLASKYAAPDFATTKFVSIVLFPTIARQRAERFEAAVEAATGLKVERRKWETYVNLAQKVLLKHAQHSHRLNLDEIFQWLCVGEGSGTAEGAETAKAEALDDLLFKPIFSRNQCIAAISAALYQDQLGESFEIKYRSQRETEGTEPTLAMKRKRSVDELLAEEYIPHGVLQIHHGLFAEFCAAFEGALELHRAYRKFNAARIQKVAEILRSNNSGFIGIARKMFDAHCEDCVERLLVSHSSGKY